MASYEQSSSSAAKSAGFYWLPPLLAVALCAVLYYPSLTSGFVHTDRNMVFGAAGDEDVTNKASADVYSQPETPKKTNGPEWTPFKPPAAAMAYDLVLKHPGNVPFRLHFASLVLQSLCVIAMFFLLKHFMPPASTPGPMTALPPAAGAILLALHPVAASSALWISAQKDLICALFLTSSLYLYLCDAAKDKQSVTVTYAFSALLFMLACTSDARAFAWPAVIAVASLHYGGAGFKERGGRTLKLLPFAAAGVYSAVVFYKNGGFTFPAAAAFLRSAGRYLLDTIFPMNLAPAMPAAGPAEGGAALAAFGAAALIGLAAVAVIATAGKKHASAGIAAAWLLAAIISQIIETRDYLADHRSYMAAAAVVFAIAQLLVPRGVPRATGLFKPVAAAAFAALLTAGFMQQSTAFSSNSRFWDRVTAQYPAEADAWRLKALGDAAAGRTSDAEQAFLKAIALAPKNDDFRLGLAALYAKSSNPEKAEAALAEGIKANPTSIELVKAYAGVEFDLGLSLTRANKPSEAVGHFVKAIRIYPRNEYFHSALATVLFKGKRYQEAYTEMAIASRLAPGNKEIAASTALVLSKAKENGVILITDGVTDSFFRNLEKLENENSGKR